MTRLSLLENADPSQSTCDGSGASIASARLLVTDLAQSYADLGLPGLSTLSLNL